jgi:poly-gamma-glutamate synthesis protein (capsule biosynthesis protein)
MRSLRVALALALVLAVALTATALGGGSPRRATSPLQPGWRGDGRAVTLAFGGDVHFEGVLGTRLAADPRTTLDGNVAALLKGSDLSMTNFESALTHGQQCPQPQPKTYVFHAPSSALTALESAHVTLVTEANNHGLDCGQSGLQQGLAIDRYYRYPIIGIGANARQAYAPYRTVIDGQRIAIIAATQVIDSDLLASWSATDHHPGVASAFDVPRLIQAVEQARRTADTVVVYLHWGTQTDECPNPLQEPLAKALVKAGADIVIGTHAHVQLGAGYLGSAFVDYGLGNLAFYDTTPPETYSGSLVVKVTGRHIDGYSWRPALIEAGLPIPDHGAAAPAATARWRSLRGCTDLTTQPTAPLAGPRTERESRQLISPVLARSLPAAPGESPGTTAHAAAVSRDG